MSDFIWQWSINGKKMYTSRDDVAERAMKEGRLVIGVRLKPYNKR